MKKLFATFLALVMMMSLLCVNAFATSLTITEPKDMGNATYAGYMILNATNSTTDSDKFAYTLNDKYTAILKSVTGKDTEADIVKYISELDTNGMRNFANDVYAAIAAADPAIAADAALATGENTVDEGYWLIAQTSEAADGETASLVMVDTAGKDALTIESKKEGVPLTKQVSDESQMNCTNPAEDQEGHDPEHVHTAACYDWSKTNESPIGATVNYRIDTQVPAAMASYKFNAFFIVGDMMGKGLTLNADSIKAFVKNADDTTTALPADAYTVRTKDTTPACENGYDFQLALVNPKNYAGKDILITYSAVVNEDAELTLTGNPNEAQVTYNPDDDVKYGGEPGNGFPTSEADKPNGKSPKDFTITYVTGVKFLKIDGTTKEALTGAQFTITGTTESTTLKWEQNYALAGEGETPVYYKLTDGKYTSEAPVMADTMKKVESDTYVGGYVVAAATDEAAATDVIVGEVRYRVSTEDDFNNGIAIYTLVKSNASDYADTTPKYVLKEGWTTQTSTKDYKTIVDVDENGIAKLPGLADGTYHVTESKVPAGYNKIDDFDIVVKWTAPTTEELAKGTDAKCTWTAKVGDTELALDTADITLFKLTVENNAGAELPSTGGIGTTIFYIVGGLLLVGAAVMLVTKKRVEGQN